LFNKTKLFILVLLNKVLNAMIRTEV